MRFIDPNEMIAARIDSVWTEFDVEDSVRCGDSPSLARAIRSWRKSRRAGYRLVKVPTLDFVWCGGGETSPEFDTPRQGRRVFLVHMGSGSELPLISSVWLHLLIRDLPETATVLADFVPSNRDDEGVCVSMDEFLRGRRQLLDLRSERGNAS